MIIIPQQPPAPLWKKILLHVKERIKTRFQQERAANWVKVPYTVSEGWRALAYMLLNTEEVDPEVKRFIMFWSNQMENGVKTYLRERHGEGIFQVTPGLSNAAFNTFYRYLHQYQQQRQQEHVEGWEQEIQIPDDPEGDPDGPPS